MLFKVLLLLLCQPLNCYQWAGTSVQDLHREYSRIFRYGNRNAASHLWSSFILENSNNMAPDQIELLFSGFCAVSGSPVRPSDYNRYKLALPLVSGKGSRHGYMHYCCWPCVCDTQDFIRVDTKTIATSEGAREYHWAVLGNPCEHEEKLQVPFYQPFDRRKTTLAIEAREVRCVDGVLQGATLSDHGFPIISMFFDLAQEEAAIIKAAPEPYPGRVSLVGGVTVQNEAEYSRMCSDRAENGYNSGMGEIFRKVAAISPIALPSDLETELPVSSPPTIEL